MEKFDVQTLSILAPLTETDKLATCTRVNKCRWHKQKYISSIVLGPLRGGNINEQLAPEARQLLCLNGWRVFTDHNSQ